MTYSDVATKPVCLSSIPAYPRKAGYSAHSVRASKEAGSTALQVYSSVSYTGRLTTMGVRLCTITGLHGSRVGFPMPLGSALQPQAADKSAPTTSTHPKLGVRSKHQRFHSCAL